MEALKKSFVSKKIQFCKKKKSKNLQNLFFPYGLPYLVSRRAQNVSRITIVGILYNLAVICLTSRKERKILRMRSE